MIQIVKLKIIIRITTNQIVLIKNSLDPNMIIDIAENNIYEETITKNKTNYIKLSICSLPIRYNKLIPTENILNT